MFGKRLSLTLLALIGCNREVLQESVNYAELGSLSTAGAGGGTSGTGDRSASITASYGELLVAFASVSGNTQAAPIMTDNKGGTYSLVGQAAWSGSTNNMLAFVRNAPLGCFCTVTLTLDTDTNTAGEIAVVSYAGIDRSGSAAVTQVALQSNRPASTTPAPTFASAASSSNAIIAAVASGDTTTTPPSGFTERKDVSQSTPTTALEVATKDSGFTGTAVTFGANQSTTYASIAIELNTSPPANVDGFAHGNAMRGYGRGQAPITLTRDVTTGSTVILIMGGNHNDIDNGPTDDKSNSFSLVGSVQDYTDWPGYGTAVYSSNNVTGGTTKWSQFVTDFDENSLFAIEIPGAGATPTVLSAFKQVANSGAGSTITTNSVTTTGPATLISFWSGASPAGNGAFIATPNNGFTVIEAITLDDPNGEVPGTMAYKTVSAAGTYDTTWTQSYAQGAEVWMIAVQP